MSKKISRVGLSPVIGLAMVVSAGLLILAGCSGLECAQGTIEQDGECVLEQDLVCGEGTVDDDGRCVVEEPVECGEGTERDPTDNRCYPTEEVCDDTTAFSSDEERCVATEDICEAGTHFDADTGLCYPDSSCQPGDVIDDDGYCVSEARALADDADIVADGNTDPQQGGDPMDLDVGDIGQQTVFAGTIGEPEDLNDSGELDQKRDFFRFQAEEGDWLEISLISLGLPNPSFVITSENGEFYERHSLEATSDEKFRQIAIPRDGDYLIFIVPGDFTDQPIGDDDWDYVGIVEQIDLPEAVEHSFSDDQLAGQIGELDENYVVVDEYDGGQTIELTWLEAPEQTEAVIQAWASPTEFVGEFKDTTSAIEIPASEQLYLTVDWISRVGPHPGDYQIFGQQTGPLDAGETRQAMVITQKLDGLDIGFSVDGFLFDSIEVSVFDADGNELIVDEVGTFSPLRLPNVDAGTYEVVYENTTDETLHEFEPVVDIVEPTPAGTFDKDQGEIVRIIQDNDGFAKLDLIVVEDNSGQVIAEKTVDRYSALVPDFLGCQVDASGEHTVYYYEFDTIDGLNIEIDAVEPVEIDSFIVDDTQSNDVVEVGHDGDGAIQIVIRPEDGDMDARFATVESGDQALAVVAPEAGAYNVESIESGRDIDGVSLFTDYISPTAITDFDLSQVGTASDDYLGAHDYYQVELEDTVSYNLELEHDGGTGVGRLFVYGAGHDRLAETRQGVDQAIRNTVEMPFEFEADKFHIIRVGNDRLGSALDFDYRLSFAEVQ